MAQPTTPEAPVVKFPPLPEIDPAQVVRAKPIRFVVDVLVDNQMKRFWWAALTLQSMMSQMALLAAANLPRVQGWNLYDEQGKLLESVTVIDFLGAAAQVTGLDKEPVDKSAKGWRAMPMITPTSQEFQKILEKAKEEGRVPK